MTAKHLAQHYIKVLISKMYTGCLGALLEAKQPISFKAKPIYPHTKKSST